jgi:DNA-binding response OmpR family regulator
MAGTAGTAARVLLVHARFRIDETVARALRGHRIDVTPVLLSAAVAWPPGVYDVALVYSDALDATAAAAGQRLKRERPRLPLVYWAPGTAAMLADVLDAGYDLWLPADAPLGAVAAQVRALCRLTDTAMRSPEPQLLTVRNVTIDFQRFEVRSRGGTLALTPTEFKIMAHLARHPGRVVRHTELFREVHGYDASEQEAKDILKVHIWRLRNKLTAAGADGDCIGNVRGFGYLLDRRSSSPGDDERDVLPGQAATG